METAVSLKSKAAAIEVEIDRRVRADKRLYESIVAEAKRAAAQWQREAEKAWRSDRIMFRHGPWEFERSYHVDAVAGFYISVSVLDYMNTGGAHPNHRTTTILWERDSGRRAQFGELLRDPQPGSEVLGKLAALLREEVAKEKTARGADVTRPLERDQWISAIKAELSTMGAPSLVPSRLSEKAAGMDFHFSPFDVGPYVEGDYTVYLSAEQLAPFLAHAARAWFGGERADQKSDEE